MSYYENVYPEIDEVVYVKIKSFSENGIYCELIEYNNKEGFLPYTELDKKIYYDKKKYFNFIKVYPMLVLDINFDKEHIDLSHSKIKSDERDKYIKYFDYLSKIYRLSEEFSKITNLSLNDVLPLTMWKFVKKDEIEESQKKFKLLLEKPQSFIDHTKEIYPEQSFEFVDNLTSRITSTTMTLYQNFDLKFYCENAVDEIKKVLDFSDIDTNIKIEYVNAPTYRLIVECKFDSDDVRNSIIEKSIEKHNNDIKDIKNTKSNDDMKNEKSKLSNFVKIISNIDIEEVEKFKNIIKERIKNKKIEFEMGDSFLAREREITIKYLQKI